MIYLIGGVSKAGKSYISKKLMEDKKIPFFSTDFLLWGYGGKGEEFDYYDDDSVVAPKLEQHIIKIICFLMEADTDYVFEGTHITPILSYKLKEMFPGKISSIFLGYENENPESKVKDIYEHEKYFDSIWYRHLSEEDFKKFIIHEIEYSKVIKEECNNYNELYFNVSNIEKEYVKIIKSIGM